MWALEVPLARYSPNGALTLRLLQFYWQSLWPMDTPLPLRDALGSRLSRRMFTALEFGRWSETGASGTTSFVHFVEHPLPDNYSARMFMQVTATLTEGGCKARHPPQMVVGSLFDKVAGTLSEVVPAASTSPPLTPGRSSFR